MVSAKSSKNFLCLLTNSSIFLLRVLSIFIVIITAKEYLKHRDFKENGLDEIKILLPNET